MTYILSESCGDSVSVPQLVFSKLKDLEDDWLRVALFIISTKITDSAVIARELRLKGPDKAKEALIFWKGAGLLSENSEPQKLSEEKSVITSPTRLTTQEVAVASQNDKNIAELLQTCQSIIGGIINETDANELVSLYLCNDLPIDMILMGVSHFVALGKKNGRYIARALLSWQQQGIDTGRACEQYLLTLEKRAVVEKEVAVLFDMPDAKFTKADSKLIAEWFESFGYDCTMVAEAIQYSGSKKSLRYVNGILRTWHTKGFKTVKDVQADSVNTMKNLQPQNIKVYTRDILQESIGKVPVYKRSGEEK